jgi:threonylcarbamoyladenosine tRNA methylthiotransferase MtaB
VPGLARLRLSSIDSIEADEELFRAIAEEERLMPHFHLSVQAGDDLILKRMKRRHARADTVAFCERVRAVRPRAAFGADLIAGFPTETEAMFENTLKLVDEAGLSVLHVFPFSPRNGTPAQRMPQMAKAIVKERAARLRAKGADSLARRLAAQVGREETILVEKTGFGRTPCFAPVAFDGNAQPGSLVRMNVTGATHDHLIAHAVS